jgi:hypothetical protein
MQIQELIKSYETKTDEELLHLAAISEQLTPEAHSALTSELARRRIAVTERLEAHIDEGEKVTPRRRICGGSDPCLSCPALVFH